MGVTGLGLAHDTEVVDLTGEDGGSVIKEPSTCPVCLDNAVGPVTPLSCRHAMCGECISEYVAHALIEEEPPKCPLCRVEIRL
ncbi:hypothetical protein PF006_g4663 [Phytophthora fragariae]|nr:hypothetical protein PF006_g4663 [Phytophthora fragariae]